MNDVSKDFAWYTIVVKHNYEKKFAEDLMNAVRANGFDDAICEAVAPIREDEEIKTNAKGDTKKVIKVEKIYPLYVFVKARMSPDIWTFLRSVDGFITVLATGGVIVTISEQEMESIKDQCGILEKEKLQKKQERLNILEKNKKVFNSYLGKTIKITNGMFTNYEGVLNNIDFNRGRVTVNVMNANLDMDMMDIEFYD